MSNTVRPLTRNQLSAFLPNQRAIRAFEQLLEQVSSILPTDIQTILAIIEEVSIDAAQADLKASEALGALVRIADALDILAAGPPQLPDGLPDDLTPSQLPTGFADDLTPSQLLVELPDDLTPPVSLGTLSQQNRDNVDVSSGSITANLRNNQTILLASSATLADGAALALGTLTNAPAAGDPTKWVSINDNGTTRYIPTW